MLPSYGKLRGFSADRCSMNSARIGKAGIAPKSSNLEAPRADPLCVDLASVGSKVESFRTPEGSEDSLCSISRAPNLHIEFQ